MSDTHCNYKENSIEPCANCPRKITMYYMCKFLQEGFEEVKQDD